MNTHELSKIEADRLQIQGGLDQERTLAERNRLGQFATPPGLALELARFVQPFLSDDTPIRFADPAIGTGAFFSALKAVLPEERMTSATGIEIDTRFARAAHHLWAPYGLEVIEGDFTNPETIQHYPQRPNLIITNPPYVRHHHLTPAQKQHLRTQAARNTYLNVNGLAGLYVYFLLIAHAWLEEDGLAAWLIPTEFMDVNYGEVLRRYFTERVTLLALHRFNSDDVQFQDALVSSAVVVFRKVPPVPDATVRVTSGGSLLQPSRAQELPLRDLRMSRKWAAFPDNGQAPPASAPLIGEARLADFFKIQRGLATGANEFFILTRAKAQELSLPDEFLQPILPSPRMIRTSVIETDTDGYPQIDPQLCLIRCDLPEDRVRRLYPSLWSYLQTAAKAGILERYLVSKRQPWYRQEMRAPAPFVCTYMGRGPGESHPFRFIWNRSRAVVPNVYLMLYPQGPMKWLVDQQPERQAEVFALLQEITAADLRLQGRVYGGGLHKIEPKELGRISAEPLVARFPVLSTTNLPLTI